MVRNTLCVLSCVVLLAAAEARAQDPVPLSLADAIERALVNSPEIAIQRGGVALADEARRRAEGAYDLQLRLDTRVRTRTDPVNTIFSGAPAGALAPRVNSGSATVGFSRLFSTGAVASASSSMSVDTTNGLFNLLSPGYFTSVGLEFRQPLLQGRHIDAPRRALRLAAVDRRRSEFALRRSVTDLVAAVERAYWTLVAARRNVAVRERSLRLSEQQRDDTQVRIEAGTAAEADLAQPLAEIERRRGDLFAAQEAMERAAVALKTAMLGRPDDPLWDRAIEPTDAPTEAATLPDVRDSLERALRDRPEVGEVEQAIAGQDVEIVAALDRLRPGVDVVASYALRGLAGARNENLSPPFPAPIVIPPDLDGHLGNSYANLLEHRFVDASVGVAVNVPVGNRAARADLTAARIVRGQAERSLEQVRQRIAADVRNAIVSLRTTAQRIDAARAGLSAAEVQLQAERDRYDAGVSNEFFLLTRQNDLAQAELAVTAALVDHQNALTEYARSAGTLLADRAIVLDHPAGEPR